MAYTVMAYKYLEVAVARGGGALAAGLHPHVPVLLLARVARFLFAHTCQQQTSATRDAPVPVARWVIDMAYIVMAYLAMTYIVMA